MKAFSLLLLSAPQSTHEPSSSLAVQNSSWASPISPASSRGAGGSWEQETPQATVTALLSSTQEQGVVALCSRYSKPKIPRFGSLGLEGSAVNASFLNILSQKAGQSKATPHPERPRQSMAAQRPSPGSSSRCPQRTTAHSRSLLVSRSLPFLILPHYSYTTSSPPHPSCPPLGPCR